MLRPIRWLAGIGAVAGLFTAGTNYYNIVNGCTLICALEDQMVWYFFPLGGAIAGLLTGLDRTRTVFVLVAICLAVSFGIFLFSPFSIELMIIAGSTAH
jgi:hypothetical protein